MQTHTYENTVIYPCSLILQSPVYIYTDMPFYTQKTIFRDHNSTLNKIETNFLILVLACAVLFLDSFILLPFIAGRKKQIN